MADDDDLRAEQERQAERIHEALAGIVADRFDRAEGGMMLTRWALVAEMTKPDGDAYLRTWRQPTMREWDEHGMLFDALFTEGEDPDG